VKISTYKSSHLWFSFSVFSRPGGLASGKIACGQCQSRGNAKSSERESTLLLVAVGSPITNKQENVPTVTGQPESCLVPFPFAQDSAVSGSLGTSG